MSYFYPRLPQADANFSCYLRKFSNNKPCLRKKNYICRHAFIKDLKINCIHSPKKKAIRHVVSLCILQQEKFASACGNLG
jgi:hypothetical protein